ncbi:ferric reductase-like transmembrane domain-containing protein [Geomicrobium sediminis]|uniref:Sulfoxide reductase heme-binding subunit YedZ n=1 Tax=Geomicrobium sediminis TaxID=1347788 RepID=A0ABS2PFE3_9BACL|nr:ferric reductase-like transmembrane domain-containing protein [Geomicrobium sediminis]MBM7633987.1 sulfoxide reductase heme-binding subunit YedZ [Geomicrobium sediminis]
MNERALKKHITLLLLTAVLLSLFLFLRRDWDPMHAWNRAFADISVLYIVAILLLGSFSKFRNGMKLLLHWRKQLGIWVAITAFAHVYIIFDGWINWDFMRLFFVFNPMTNRYDIHPGFAIGNLIGIVALLYVFALFMTSNKKSIKVLGKEGWKYLQQRVHIYYILVVLHTIYFLFFHIPLPNFARIPFLLLIVLVWLVHVTGFFKVILETKPKR